MWVVLDRGEDLPLREGTATDRCLHLVRVSLACWEDDPLVERILQDKDRSAVNICTDADPHLPRRPATASTAGTCIEVDRIPYDDEALAISLDVDPDYHIREERVFDVDRVALDEIEGRTRVRPERCYRYTATG